MSPRVCDRVYLVGGPDLTDPRDCLVYLVDLGELVLIDCGAGPSWGRLRDRINEAGFDPDQLHTLLLTHGHVDHIGAAAAIREQAGCRLVAHEADAAAIESGDPRTTAASWYGMTLPRVTLDERLVGASADLSFSQGKLEIVHTPGHTPGSVAVLLSTRDGLVLFGQDIHGPFHPDFGSDIAQWRVSMERLLAREPDILCEGHYGVFRGKRAVREFITEQLAAHG